MSTYPHGHMITWSLTFRGWVSGPCFVYESCLKGRQGKYVQQLGFRCAWCCPCHLLTSPRTCFPRFSGTFSGHRAPPKYIQIDHLLLNRVALSCAQSLYDLHPLAGVQLRPRHFRKPSAAMLKCMP